MSQPNVLSLGERSESDLVFFLADPIGCNLGGALPAHFSPRFLTESPETLDKFAL